MIKRESGENPEQSRCCKLNLTPTLSMRRGRKRKTY
jgi:hypothetical protein